MKKISLFIQLAVLTAAMPAFGWVGGPFDNGDYGILMERGGFYQASFTYKNGSGYALWTPDNLQGALNTGSLTTNAGYGSLFTPASGRSISDHNGNRSVFYYKGITYFGMAMGEVTLDERQIQGFCNAQSEIDFQSQQTTATATFLTAQATSTASSSTVVQSGRSYTLNLNWTGRVTDTAPQMTFVGEGEMAIISPNGREALATLAYQGYSGLIDAIVQAVSQAGQTGLGFIDPNLFSQAQAAITGALIGTPGTPAIPAATNTTSNTTVNSINTVANGVVTNNTQNTITNSITQSNPETAAVAGTGGLEPFITGTGPDNSYEEAERERVKVSGIRRFF